MYQIRMASIRQVVVSGKGFDSAGRLGGLRRSFVSTITVPGGSRSPERSLHIVTTGKTGSNRYPIPAW
jgi:hypothetical protein